LKCSTSFEVEVERRLTVWCWRVILVFWYGKSPGKEKLKIKICFSWFEPKYFLSRVRDRKRGERYREKSHRKI
jgi:hypothetical protein